MRSASGRKAAQGKEPVVLSSHVVYFLSGIKKPLYTQPLLSLTRPLISRQERQNEMPGVAFPALIGIPTHPSKWQSVH